MSSNVPLKKKSDLPRSVIAQVKAIEAHLFADSYRITNLRCDRAKENYSDAVMGFNHIQGIKIDFSPAYASKSNGAAERLV